MECTLTSTTFGQTHDKHSVLYEQCTLVDVFRLNNDDNYLNDGLGIFGSNLFNVDTTLGAGNDHGASGFPVKGDREVELTAEILALDNADGRANLAGLTGLLGVDSVSQHTFGNIGSLILAIREKANVNDNS